MEYLYVKALHIIFVITWFAGLFYIVRLFIYQAEAEKKAAPAKRILQDQYKLMSKRLWYIITWPSCILASLFAFLLLYLNPVLLTQPWMWVKLIFVFLLYLYQITCHKIYRQFQNDKIKYSASKLRLWNELPTLVLVAIIFLVELQNTIHWVWALVSFIGFGLMLISFVKFYKKVRRKKKWDHS